MNDNRKNSMIRDAARALVGVAETLERAVQIEPEGTPGEILGAAEKIFNISGCPISVSLPILTGLFEQGRNSGWQTGPTFDRAQAQEKASAQMHRRDQERENQKAANIRSTLGDTDGSYEVGQRTEPPYFRNG